MSLKFQRDDSLDKKFEEFAFFPDEKKEEKKPDIERFLNPTPKKKKLTKKINKKQCYKQIISECNTALFDCFFNGLPCFFFSLFRH